ncbi:ankyrin repeat-containing protein [Anaeramoeba ignava]|uniref:Ankyrin repeat-containing protein n=1 Tax=Anaeramoeba ignava TaxID=1746090 RepID=A0A9Q0RAN4_ANAIG|nr:ankyrin repeat-containing protein [Anaeramoeba ignava]
MKQHYIFICQSKNSNLYENYQNFLFANGANINDKTSRDMTPLHFCLTENNETPLHFICKISTQLKLSNFLFQTEQMLMKTNNNETAFAFNLQKSK